MKQLKNIRKREGLSQEALAERVGCNRDTIRRWEKGTCEPNITQTRRLAQALGANLSDLLDLGPEDPQFAPADRSLSSGASSKT